MPKQGITNRQVQGGSTPIVTTTETVIAQLSGVSTDRADAIVNLEAVAQVTWGTGTTAATLRVRRGVDATGTLVGSAVAEGMAAGATDDMELQVQDQPGEVAGQSYVLTVQQTGASANGTAQQSSLAANY